MRSRGWPLLVSAGLITAFSLAVGVEEYPARALANVGVFELDGEAANDDVAGVDEAVDVFNGTTANAIDAIFFADGGALTNDLVFSGGGSKDVNDISSWSWEIGGVLDKNDVTNAFVASYVAPSSSGIGGQPVITTGLDRYDNNGSASFGFWFLQESITLGEVAGTNRFVDENGATATHAAGDLLLVVNFQGGIPTIEAYTWEATGLTLAATGGAACGPTLPDSAALCGITNAGATAPAPWPYTPKSGPAGTFPVDSYLEAAINVQAVVGADELGCYRTVVVESRSSQQTTAVQNDLNIAPLGACGLDLTKSGPSTAQHGDEVTYTFEIRNDGIVPLDIVSLADDVLGDISAELTADGCSSIPAQQSCIVDATWTVDEAFADDSSVITNTATVTSSPPNGATGPTATDSHAVEVLRPDLTLTKTDGVSAVVPGTTTTYTLGFANIGGADATGVVLTETVPSGGAFVATSSTAGWSCADGAAAGTTCELALGAVDAGDSGTVAFAVAVDPSATGTLVNEASIADDGTKGADLDPTDNVAADVDDLGVVASGRVTGRVWRDADADGRRDDSEPDISGVRLEVLGAGPDDRFGTADDIAVDPVVTASPYTFADLSAGRYRVTVDSTTLPTGLRTPTAVFDGVRAATALVTVAAGAETAGVDFGFVDLVPLAVDDEVTTDEGVAVTIDVLSNDFDPEALPLTVASLAPPSSGSASITAGGEVVYDPAPGFDGRDAFLYTACDPGGECGVATVRVTVRNTNDPPVVSTSSLRVVVGATPAPITVTDPERDVPYQVTRVSGAVPSGTTLNADGSFSGTTSEAGSFAFTVRACDRLGACADYSLAMAVSGSSIPPTGSATIRLAIWALGTLGLGALLVAAGHRPRVPPPSGRGGTR